MKGYTTVSERNVRRRIQYEIVPKQQISFGKPFEPLIGVRKEVASYRSCNLLFTITVSANSKLP